MSKNSKDLTKEEKTKIALEAAGGDQGVLNNLAVKYDVSVDDIKKWMRESGISDVEQTDAEDRESLTLDVTDEFAKDYEFGATPDNLNYTRLTFWSAFGTVVIILFVVAIYYAYDYTDQSSSQQTADRSLYYEFSQLQESNQQRLNSFGVVDLEEGIYHIPIDSAISRIAEDTD